MVRNTGWDRKTARNRTHRIGTVISSKLDFSNRTTALDEVYDFPIPDCIRLIVDAKWSLQVITRRTKFIAVSIADSIAASIDSIADSISSLTMKSPGRKRSSWQSCCHLRRALKSAGSRAATICKTLDNNVRPFTQCFQTIRCRLNFGLMGALQRELSPALACSLDWSIRGPPDYGTRPGVQPQARGQHSSLTKSTGTMTVRSSIGTDWIDQRHRLSRFPIDARGSQVAFWRPTVMNNRTSAESRAAGLERPPIRKVPGGILLAVLKI